VQAQKNLKAVNKILKQQRVLGCPTTRPVDSHRAYEAIGKITSNKKSDKGRGISADAWGGGEGVNMKR
jgi:hypothetical protein